MIPVYLVPLSILLHFASLYKLRQARVATRQIRGASSSPRPRQKLSYGMARRAQKALYWPSF